MEIASETHSKYLKTSFVVIRFLLFTAGLGLISMALILNETMSSRLSDWTVLRIPVIGLGLVLMAAAGALFMPGIKARLLDPTRTFNAAYLLKLGIWLLCTWLVVEILLHVFFKSVWIENTEDWGRGSVALPGSMVLSATEGYGIMYYSANGEIRSAVSSDGREEKYPNVVVLGDSHTEASQVMDSQKFVSVAEQALWNDQYQVNLRNLGASGQHIAYYAGISQSILEEYHPETVVIQLSVPDFDSWEAYNKSGMYYFEAGSNNSLSLVHNTSVKGNKYLRKISTISDLYYLWKENSSKLIPASKPAAAAETDPQAARAETQQRMQLQLAELHQAYAGVPVVIVLLPHTPSLEGDQIIWSNPDYGLLVQEVSRYSDWSVVDPTQAFADLVAEGHFPRGFVNTKPDSGHLNSYGHAAVGRLLAEQLEEVLP